MSNTAASAIRTARLRAGMTQVELARRMGTTQTAVARLENKASNPRMRTLARALEAAGERLFITSEPTGAAEIDLTQLRAQLALSPAQRAIAHDVAYEETRTLVNAGRAHAR